MLGDSYLYLKLAEERAKEGLRKAEQARHIQAAGETRSVRRRWLPAAPMLSALLGARHHTAKLIDCSEEVHP